MMLLDGVKTSEKIAGRIYESLKKAGLKLSVILVGDNPSSVIYVNAKKKKCLSLGVDCEIHSFPEKVAEKVAEKIVGPVTST